MPIIKLKTSSSSTTTSGTGTTTGTTTGTGTNTSTTGTTTGSASGVVASHTHVISDVSTLTAALSGKANTTHSHIISDIPGLNTAIMAKADTAALATKAAAIHSHIGSDISDLSTILSGKANTVHTHDTSSITGLNAILNNKADVSALANKSIIGHNHVASDISDISNILSTKAPTIHNHDISSVTGLQTALDGKASTAEANSSTNGLMSSVDKVKLNGISANATSNSTDAVLKERANHTGSQSISTVAGLQTALDSKASSTHNHAVATSSADGLMSAADKTKLDGIVPGSSAATASTTIAGVSGLQAALDAKAGTAVATTTTNGLMASTDKAKLDNVAPNATANSSDSSLKDRANHTGVQPIASVAGLQTAIDNINTSIASVQTASSTAPAHTHEIANITGLSSKLTTIETDITALKAAGPITSPSGTSVPAHSHEIANVTGLASQLSTITTDIAENDIAIAAINTSIASTTTNLNALVNKVGYSASSTTVKQDFDNLKTTTDDNTSKLTALTTRVATLEISGGTVVTQIPRNVTVPTITGTIGVGQTLTCSIGTWNNSPVSYGYQWYKRIAGSSVIISSATNSAYTIVSADVGSVIYCSVTATNSAGNSSVITVDTIAVTAAPSVITNPAISGSSAIGSTLTSTTGVWSGAPTFTYQWFRGTTQISNATNSSYTTVSADANQLISCKITATNSAGFTIATSNNVTVTAAPAVVNVPVISGGTTVGSVLSATNGSWTNSPTSYSYQWKKNNTAISGATTNTYTTLVGDVGGVITCEISATNSAGVSSVTSSNSITVIAAQASAPVVQTVPVITGSAIVGSSLTSSTGTWNNSPTNYTYQWFRNNVAISSATGASYTSGASDVGQTISCIVTASNNAGNVSATASNSVVIGNQPVVITPSTPAGSNPVTYAITGVRTFNVGPGQTYADPDTVPWGNLVAGDVVNIFHRATPYTHNVMIFGVGTQTNPIIINGVTDALGNRPKFNLTGSKTAAGSTAASSTAYPEYGEGLGGFVLKRQKGATSGPKPEYISIKNIEVYGGSNGTKFTALNGSLSTRSGGAGVWCHDTKNCTIENCVIYDNAFGIFVQAKNDVLAEANEKITLRNNRIYANGVTNSYLEHNVYMQSTSPIVEGNYIGPLRTGALGSSYKSRSSGEIFRYNYVEAHARGIDFVHTEDQDQGIRSQADYRYIHCYGNIILNIQSGVCIHVGGDNGGEDSTSGTLVRPGSDFTTPSSLWYRNQLYFYNNTYITKANNASLFDLSLAGGQTLLDGTVEQRTRVDAWNNIFYTTGSGCAWVESVGSVYFRGNNLVAGNVPANSRYASSRINIENLGTNVVTGNLAFIDEANFNFSIASGSVAIDNGVSSTPSGLPSTFQNYPVAYQPYGSKTNGLLARSVSGSAMDLGAFEYGSSTVVTPIATSSPTNSSLPIVSGNTAVGSTILCSTGSWSNSPSSFTYQWKRGTNVISSETSATYTTTSGDISQNITCTVTAANSVGSNSASSSNSILITAIVATPAPVCTVVPNITGSSIVGSALNCSTGTWSNSPTLFKYQWKRSGTNITDATSSSYTSVTADVNQTITCVVTAENNTGATTAIGGNSILVVSSTVVSNPLPPSTPPNIGNIQESNPVTSAITGVRTFNVGPGQTYADPNTVPWSTLVAGDVVNIFHRSTPYNHIIAICGQGTAANKIIVNGVTDANGNRPVFDYSNGAVVASGTSGIWGSLNSTYGYQRLGGITVINKADVRYLVDTPKWIEIKNLEVKGAYTGNVSGTSIGPDITLLNGSKASWFTGAGIHLQSSEDVLIENCVLANNTFGVFTMAKGDLLWYTNQRVILRNNRIYDNGVVGEYYQHNVYMQSTSPIIEGNYIGKLRTGAFGSAYKSRSSGEIFRYNWVESHARAMDFVHSEEQVNGIAAQENYKYLHCYGNVVVNDINVGEFATNAIHLGGDNGGEDGYDGNGTHFNSLISPGSLNSTPIQLIYREQMYFYNNTVIINGNNKPYSSAHVFDLSLAGGNVGAAGYVHPRTRVDAWNNVFYTANTDIMTWVEACGTANLRGSNYVFGTIADHESQRPDWVTLTKETIISGDPSFQSFSTCNYKPTATSPFLNAGSTPTNLPATFQNYPVTHQPQIRTNGMKARNVVGNSIDLGAFEIEDATVPSVTTFPSISGAATIGSTLTASPGVWTNAPTFVYQWMRSGVAIAGQTANVYTTTIDDNGKNMTVRITTTANGKSSTAESASKFVGEAAAQVTPPTTPTPTVTTTTTTTTTTTPTSTSTDVPTIIGVPSVGQNLYCSFVNGSAITAISYKWFVDGEEIPNQQMIYYTVKASDSGKTITCKTIVGGALSAASNGMAIGSTVAQTGVYSFSQTNNTTVASIDSKWASTANYYVIKDGFASVTEASKSWGGAAIYAHGSTIKTMEIAILNGITSLFSMGLDSASTTPYDVRISPTSVQIRKNTVWQADIPLNFDTTAVPVIARIIVDGGKFAVDINNVRFFTLSETNVATSSAYFTITTTTITNNRLDYFRVA